MTKLTIDSHSCLGPKSRCGELPTMRWLRSLRTARHPVSSKSGVNTPDRFLILYYTAEYRSSVVHALLLGLGDYTTDQRGDVGSWIRVSCSTGLGQLAEHIAAFGSQRMQVVINGLVKLLMEKLEVVRVAAGAALEKTSLHAANIPWRKNLIDSM